MQKRSRLLRTHAIRESRGVRGLRLPITLSRGHSDPVLLLSDLPGSYEIGLLHCGQIKKYTRAFSVLYWIGVLHPSS